MSSVLVKGPINVSVALLGPIVDTRKLLVARVFDRSAGSGELDIQFIPLGLQTGNDQILSCKYTAY